MVAHQENLQSTFRPFGHFLLDSEIQKVMEVQETPLKVFEQALSTYDMLSRYAVRRDFTELSWKFSRLLQGLN